MNWITASLLGFAFSILTYLLVRKTSLMKVNTEFNNLAMFVIPAIVYVLLGIVTHESFVLTFEQTVVVTIIAVFFSYFGNYFSLRAIEYAPNPGYSLTISKSYVVFTTLVAVFLFGAALSLKNVTAIALIVLFSALIMMSDSKKQKKVNSLWLPLSFGAFFCWGFLSLGTKYLFNQGVGVTQVLMYTTGIVTLVIIAKNIRKKVLFSEIKQNFIMFLAVGLATAGFYFFMYDALRTAPNVGYVNAINASSISVVTIFAGLLFKDDLTIRKIIGVFGVLGGLILLLIR